MFMKSKFNFRIFLFIIILIFCEAYYIKEGHASNSEFTNFTFGSNYLSRYSESENTNIFQKILSHNSQLFLWLGNAVYLDKPTFNYFQSSPDDDIMNWEIVKAIYKKVKKNIYYDKFRKKTPIVGTWGDEEYGVNNGNEDNKLKEGYKQYYLDFLEVAQNEGRREYQNLGIYSTYSFGQKDKTVRFIILDLKYNQKSYLKEGTNDMLGEQQWEWLENIFKFKSETYTFICASNQILSNDRFIMKKWYSNSRKKLFDLIGKYKKSGVIFLTGGLGFSQILKTFCPLPNIGYNLYEFTSSGLSHINKLSNFWNNFYHNDYIIEGTNYDEVNFGQVKINWGDKNINESFVELEIWDKDDNKVTGIKINYNDLLFRENSKDYYLNENNLKEIEYMNIHSGEDCQREIYHRVRTPLMVLKYYFTHWNQLPKGIFTSIIIIIFVETLFSKRFYYIFIFAIICFLFYCVMIYIEINKYNKFRNEILNIE